MGSEALTQLLVRQAWAALGGEEELLGQVHVVGNPVGLLPSPERPSSGTHRSLAQTGQWLLSAGATQEQQAREPDHEPFMVTLPGATGAVQVVGPPGRTGDLSPRWAFTSELGGHPPTFAAQ